MEPKEVNRVFASTKAIKPTMNYLYVERTAKEWLGIFERQMLDSFLITSATFPCSYTAPIGLNGVGNLLGVDVLRVVYQRTNHHLAKKQDM